ncbi:MAG: type II secretion system F family protein, partial [Acidaminobacter sp.]|uniref:type II secretion system F family protein n=1 Tax=Acidaminobacter sp. TaxID=1872102 RepID=UPI001380B15F
MPVYKFKALTPNGATLEGTETANTHGEMIVRLKERQYYPISVEEVIQKDLKDINFLNKVSIKQIAVFGRQFSTMLNAGVTIVNTLDILRQQTEHKKFKQVISDLYEDVQKGYTFSEAMEKHNDVFPNLMTYMVAAGEASGSLDIVMERMATHYEKEFKVNNKVKSAMVYPAVLSVVATLVVVFLLTFVMPTFLSMFEGSGVPLPAPTRLLLAISNSFRNFWYIYALVIL